MPLEEGIAEVGGQINIFPCIGWVTISLEVRSIPRVEEAVDCGRRQGQDGGSGGSDCRQDDALGRWWETVPPIGLLFCLALGGDNGVERFRGPGRHISQDTRETHVVL